MKLSVHIDLAFGNIARQVRDRMGNVCKRKYVNISNSAMTADNMDTITRDNTYNI